MLQKQLAFTLGSRNKQVILDSYQSEIFHYTTNPLMFKSREHKLSWSSLFGQDDWILASFFSYFFFQKRKKKNRPISSHFDLMLGRIYFTKTRTSLTRKDGKKMHFWARNLSDVYVSGLPFSCNSVHEVLTSALITQVYRQNLLR